MAEIRTLDLSRLKRTLLPLVVQGGQLEWRADGERRRVITVVARSQTGRD